MPKQMNTNLKFTSSTEKDTTDDNVAFSDYSNCQHLLPCGDCAITMRPCHHNWGKWVVTCLYKGR